MSATNGSFWSEVFLKTSGAPYAGVRVFHYVAGGTTTNLDVFIDGALTTAAANPVVGDSSGRVSFYGSNTYRLLIKSSVADGDLTLYDYDPVELVHHTATLRAQDRAISLPSASSASRGRLFGTTDGGGDVLKLWIQKTASAWNEILSLPSLTSMIQFTKGTDAASTTNVTLLTDGNFFDITGTNTIESFTAFQAGTVIWTRFTGTGLTLTYGASALLLPGNANYLTVQNEVVGWLSVGGGIWRMMDSSTFLPTAGAPITNYGVTGGSTGWTQKNIMPVGLGPLPWSGRLAPSHWVLANGQNLLNQTYFELLDVALDDLVNSGLTYAAGTGSNKVDFATTDVDTGTNTITETAHGLSNGQRLYLTSTGTIPAGLASFTKYFIVGAAANTFQLALTSGGAAIDITSQGTGTHSFYKAFLAADVRGRVPMGVDNMGGSDAARVTSASTGGANADTLGGVGGNENLPTHVHQEQYCDTTDSTAQPARRFTASGSSTFTTILGDTDTSSTDGGPLNTLATGTGGVTGVTQPWVALNYIIYAGV
jgi:microcystin-dependent protein